MLAVQLWGIFEREKWSAKVTYNTTLPFTPAERMEFAIHGWSVVFTAKDVTWNFDTKSFEVLCEIHIPPSNGSLEQINAIAAAVPGLIVDGEWDC